MSRAGWGRGEDEPFMAKLPPGPHRLPRELVRDHQRRRILLAALDVFAVQGFAAATVKDLIRKAHVSRATFYEHFADKEACLAELHEEILDSLLGQVGEALRAVAGWREQVVLAVESAVRLLAEDPRLAAICAIEAPAVHAPRIRTRHERLVAELCRGLRRGRAATGRGEDLPEILEPALVCGAIYMVGRSVVHGEGPDPASLGAELAELMLIPYSA